MTIKEVVEKTTQFFSDKKISSARLDAEILLSEALGMRRLDLYLNFDQMLNPAEVEKCREMVRRRSQGEPVAYILKKKDFFHSTFFVDARVLIPRPETEELVEKALAWIKTRDRAESAVRVLDLGCGSGCIGLSLAKELPNATVDFVDISKGALEVTQLNAETLGIDGTRVHLHESPVQKFNFQKGPWDLIVANPPYIAEDDERIEMPVKKFEPSGALFARDAGLGEIKDWLTGAVTALSPEGYLIFEIGDLQKDPLQTWLEAQVGSSKNFKFAQDLSGKDRFLIMTKAEN